MRSLVTHDAPAGRPQPIPIAPSTLTWLPSNAAGPVEQVSAVTSLRSRCVSGLRAAFDIDYGASMAGRVGMPQRGARRRKPENANRRTGGPNTRQCKEATSDEDYRKPSGQAKHP